MSSASSGSFVEDTNNKVSEESSPAEPESAASLENHYDLGKKTEEGAACGHQPSNTGWLFEDDKKPNKKAIYSVDPDSEYDSDDDYHLYNDYDYDYDDYDGDCYDGDDYYDYDGFGSDLDLEDLLLMDEQRWHGILLDNYAKSGGAKTSDDRKPPTDKELRKSQHCEKILSKLSDDQMEGTFCDVVFLIEEQRFPAHKGVLKALGSYFEAMFSGKFNESDENEITIGNVTKEVFQFIIDFAYGRELSLTLDEIFQTFVTAEMLCMDDLVEECKRRLPESWKPSETFENEPQKLIEECTRVISYAENMKLTEFSVQVLEDIKRELEKKNDRKDILLMMTPKVLFPLINQSFKWDSTKETEKVTFLTEWLRKEPDERLAHVSEMLRILKLELVLPDAFETFVVEVTRLMDECMPVEMKLDLAATLRKVEEKRAADSPKVKVKICLFSQNPLTLEGHVRLYRESESGEASWQYKSVSLDAVITESVEVEDQLVLFHRDTFYIVNLKMLHQTPVRKRSNGLRRLVSYVACAKNRQIIVAGGTTKNGTDIGITINALHYWKNKPALVRLFTFTCVDAYRYKHAMALAVSDDTFYVLARDSKIRGGSNVGALLVSHKRAMATYPFMGLQHSKLNEGKYLYHRVIHPDLQNDKIFLVDQYDSMFSGICVKLEKSTQTNRAFTMSKISDDLPKDESGNSTNGEWIGSVKGTLLASCKISTPESGHLLLVAQGTNLALFSMKSLKEFAFHRLLPKFESNAIDIDFPNTNVFFNVIP